MMLFSYGSQVRRTRFTIHAAPSTTDATPTIAGEAGKSKRKARKRPTTGESIPIRVTFCPSRSNPAMPEASLYNRLEVPVVYEDGTSDTVWVYLYNAPLGRAERIASGDYLEHLKVR